jgi:hypothetical protein
MLGRLQKLYPNLDFSRIQFYQGMPLPDSLFGDRGGRTIPGIFGTKIYVHDYSDCPNPGSQDESFLTLAHECVHALQAQDLGWFGFQMTYLTCFLAGGSQEGGGNCLEDEAYSFANGQHQGPAKTDSGLVRKALNPLSVCLCQATESTPFPWLQTLTRDNPAADGALAPLQLAHTACSVSSCHPNFLQRLLGGWLAVAGTIYPNLGPVSRTGAIIGAAVVGVGAALLAATVTAGATGGGLLVSFVAGAAAGFVGFLVGVIFGGIIGGLLGGIVDGIASVFDAIFGGGDDNADSGRINLLFSTDSAHTWANKATFERSRAQPALAFGPTELGIGWIGNDGRPNTVIAAANQARKATYDEQSSTSGAGLAPFSNGYLLAFRGRDDARSPNVALTYGDNALHRKQTIDVGGPRDSTVTVAQGLESVFVAAVDSGSQFIIRALEALNDGPGAVQTGFALQDTTDNWGTPAIAYGSNKLYVAWAGTDPDHHLNVTTIDLTPSPIGPLYGPWVKHTLPAQGTSGATGPALALNDATGVLYLAWIDPGDAVHVAQSSNGFASVTWESIIWGETSRHNAGPGLAVHLDGTVAVAWIGTG